MPGRHDGLVTKIEKVVQRYADAAILSDDETVSTRRRNRAAGRILDCLRVLREETDRGLAALRGLARHEVPGVRGWAATHLLSLDNELV